MAPPVNASRFTLRSLAAVAGAVAATVGMAFAGAGGTRLPTLEEAKSWQKSYRQERETLVKTGALKRFLPDLLDHAEAIARRADAALAKGRLLQATEAYRQARWQLPYQGPHLPDHVSRIFGNLRLRHGNEILSAAFSADGRWLASASRDHAVKIWDMSNGHEEIAYRGHERYVRVAAFSPDGSWIASAGGDKDIRVWDSRTGKDLRTLQGTGSYITALVISPDGKHVLAAGDDRKLHIFDATTGTIKRTIDYMLFGGLRSLAFNADGTRLAAGAENGYVRLWVYPDIVTTNAVEYWAQQDNEGASNFLTFSPDGRLLLRCGPDAIKIYDVAQPGAAVNVTEPRRILQPPDDPQNKNKMHQYTCATFSKDGRMLYTGCTDGIIRLYEMEGGLPAGTFKGHNGPITALVFNQQGTQLASASTDFTVRLWNFDIVLQSHDFIGHTAAVWSADFSPDGERIVSCGADRTCRTWDVGSGKVVHTLGDGAASLTTARSSPDGKSVLTGGGDRVLRLYEADSGMLLRTFEGHTGTVMTAAFSGDGSKIVSGAADQSLIVWTTATGKPVTRIDTSSLVMAVLFTPDGQQVAAGTVDQRVRFFDAATGKPGISWVAHNHAVGGLSFDAQGTYLATCGYDNLVKVWPTATLGKNPIVLAGHTGPLSGVALRPDGKFLVSAGSDSIIKLWKEEGGTFKETQIFRGHKDWVTSLTFSKNGYFILSASADKTLKIWELATRELPLTAEHTGAVECVAISPDGKKMASGATDKTIKVWDPKTGVELLTLRGHGDAVVALAFTPDSKTLFSSGGDRNIRRWDLATGKELPALDNQDNISNFINPVPQLAIRTDGKRLAAWVPFDERGTRVSLFNPASGDEVVQINDRGKHVLGVGWSRDFKRIALGTKDGVVRIYDIPNETLERKPNDFQVFAKDIGVASIAVAPDGGYIAAGGETGKVLIVDPGIGTVRKTLSGHQLQVTAIAISPDGSRVITAGLDNVVKLWDASAAKELRSWSMPPLVQERGGFVTQLTFTPDGRFVVTANANTTLFMLELP
jgi:WD40 repeat protein